jgi:hypothetical protein
MQFTALSFKHSFACGSKVLRFVFLFALAERKKEKEELYRSAKGSDCIRYATA